MNERKALVVGATGLSGGHTAARLHEDGWHVTTLSRQAAEIDASHRHVAIDLADPEAGTRALADLSDITHVFICTWSRQATEAENCRVNRAMMTTLFDGLSNAPLRHAALVTGLKHYLGPFEDYAHNKPQTPFREDQPRLPGDNFYYDQEDVLFEAAEARGFTWTVHRPHTMIGLAIGNAMNMAVTLAVYASICRETGRPFIFPGSPEQYAAVTDVTDARILADQLVWAASTPEAANMPFNIVNGDVFRWEWMWARIAEWFGLEAAPYPGHPIPLEEQMSDADEVWRDIVARRGLEDHAVGTLASWWHTDADLGREIECITDMRNARRLGFAAHRQSLESFTDVFAALHARRVIP